MITLDTRIYVQLRPVDESIVVIQDMQNALLDSGKAVSVSSLHLTILHIGEARRLYNEVIHFVPVSESDFLSALSKLIDALEYAVSEYSLHKWQLETKDFTYFGDNGSTLVVLLSANQSFTALHSVCMKVLKQLLTDCGIKNYAAFFSESRTLAHSDILNPHLTLLKAANPLNMHETPIPRYMEFNLSSVI